MRPRASGPSSAEGASKRNILYYSIGPLLVIISAAIFCLLGGCRKLRPRTVSPPAGQLSVSQIYTQLKQQCGGTGYVYVGNNKVVCVTDVVSYDPDEEVFRVGDTELDLSEFMPYIEYDQDSHTLTVENTKINLDQYKQTLSLYGTTLSISGGNSVSFAGWDINASDDVRRLNDLEDVNVAGAASGQYLKFNGSTWVPAPVKDTLSQLTCSSGQVAKWNGTAWECANDLSSPEASAADELNTAFVYDTATNILSITDAGGTLSADLSELEQNLSFDPVTYSLAISEGNSVDLSALHDVYTAGNGLTESSHQFSISAPACSGTDKLQWNGTAFVCAPDQNTTYTAGGTLLQLTGTTFSIREGTLSPGFLCTYSPSSGLVCNTDPSSVGTDSQTLTWDDITNRLSISGGNTVDLSSLHDVYTAGSGLQLSGNQFSINSPTCSGTDKLQWNGTAFVCATDQDTTYTAGRGLTLTGTTFDTNTPTSACPSGQVLTWDGNNFTCTPDQDTTYSAGTGLALTGTVFSLNAGIDLLNDVDTSTTPPTTGQTLKWDGTNWVPQDDSDTLAGLSCSSGQIAKWNGSAWVCSNDDTGTALPSGTTTNSTLRWDGSSWVENTGFLVDATGVVQSGTWHGTAIDISDYTNLAAGNGLSLTDDTMSVNAPTCSGTDKLQWNGTAFVCAADQDTTYTAGRGLTLTGTTFDTNTPTSACPSGQVLTWDGNNFTCTPDQDTTYTAGGTLLQLTGTTFSVKEGTLTNGYLCTYSDTNGLVCNTDPSSVGTDSQTLTWEADTDTLTISGGNSVVMSDLTQTLSLSGTTLSISSGNSVDFTNWDTDVTDDVQQLADLTDVTLTSPASGQVLKYNGTNWVNASDSDTLASLSCSSGQIAKWNGSAWTCSNDEVNDSDTDATNELNTSFTYDNSTNQLSITDAGGTLTVDLSDLQDTYTAGNGLQLNSNEFSINSPTCSGTDKLQWNGTAFVCAPDQDTTYSAGTGLALTGTVFSLNAGIDLLNDVDTSTTPPTTGQTLKWDGTNWVPQDDSDTLAGLSCSSGQIAKWNGSAWVCSNDDTGTALPSGTTTNSTLRWDGSSWVENTGFLVDATGVVQSGTWHGTAIDISDYTNLAAGNGLSLTDDTMSVNAPTCSGTDKLQWNGTAFVCAADQDTTYTAGRGLTLTGTTFDTNTPTSACPSGQVLTWDGNNFTCTPDQDTTYTAGGTLLQLTGTTFSVKEGTLTNGYLCTYSDTNGLVCNTDPSSVGTDSQTLTWEADTDTLTISGGNSVVMSDLTQTLSLSGTTLSISSGNSVDFTNWDTDVTDDVQQLNDLTDVSISSPATNHVLKYDGTNWVNSLLNFIDLGDTPSDYGTAGYLLKTTGSGIDYVAPSSIGYWQRVNQGPGVFTLEPKISGDHLRLTGTSRFYYTAINQGEILFGLGSAIGTQISGDSTFHWDSSNKRLGVGVTNPVAQLDVRGDKIILQTSGYAGAGTLGDPYFYIGEDAATAEKYAKLGWNTTDSYLELVTGFASALPLRIGQNSMSFGNVTPDASALFRVADSSSEKFRISSDGKVGVGTTSPEAYVHISTDSIDTALRVDSQKVTTPFYDWDYYLPITLHNNNPTKELLNYQVKITMDTQYYINNGLMNSDCSDIRFAYADTEMMIPYWIEEGCNTTDTVIWLKIDRISPGANLDIKMYMKNPSAVSQSNPEAVFDFFDDFSGTALDTSKWTVESHTSNWSYSVTGGELVIQTTGNTDWWGGSTENYFAIYTGINQEEVFEAKISYNDATALDYHSAVIAYYDADNVFFWGPYNSGAPTSDSRVEAVEFDSGQGNLYSTSYTVPGVYGVVDDGSTTHFFLGGSDMHTESDTSLAGQWNKAGFTLKDWGLTSGAEVHIDWALKRKYDPYGVAVSYMGVPTPVNKSVDSLQTVFVVKRGKVGIQTDDPQYALQVGNPGDGSYAVANAWYTFSDRRWKESIQSIAGEQALEKVLALDGVTFVWKKSKDKQAGFIAQDVQKVIPEAVDKLPDGTLAVDYTALIPYIVNAIKQVNQRIENIAQSRWQLVQSKLVSQYPIKAPSAQLDSAQVDNLTVQSAQANSVSAQEVTTHAVVVASDDAGKVKIEAGKTSLTVTLASVKASDVVMVTPVGKPVALAVKVEDGKFTISLEAPLTEDLEVMYMVVHKR